MGRSELRESSLVSVIIPTHNRAQLVREAIESVLAQEGAGEEFNMEVIVVDDASLDDTAEVVGRYSGVRYCRLANAGGMSAVRNAGIKASTGKYVAFLDDDDLMLPQRLKLQVPLMEAHPEVGVVYSQNTMRGKILGEWWPDASPAPSGDGFDKIWPDARRAPSGDVFRAFLIEEFVSMNTPLVRREAFEKAGYFDESLTNMEHYDMFLRLAFHVPFAFAEGNVAINRVNWTGVFQSHLAREEGYARMLPKVVDKALAMLPDSSYSRELRREVHVALVPRLFCMLGRIPDLEGIRSYVKIVFRACPWLLTEPGARASLVLSVNTFAGALGSPIAVIHLFCNEFRMAPKPTFKDRLKLRILYADLWRALAMNLGFGSRPYRGSAAYAALWSLLYNPLSFGPDCLKLAFRIVFGSRVYSYLRSLMGKPSRTTLAPT